jgi:hypothetical protein
MSDYRWATQAYPSAYRKERTDEIVALANELSDGRWSIRQSLGLLAGGLQTRARLATQSSPRGVWESGARSALLVLFIWAAAGPLSSMLRLQRVVEFQEPWYVLAIPLLFIVFLTVSTRWWVASVITIYALWGIWTSVGDYGRVGFVAGALASTAVMVGIAWWLALATDGRRVLGFIPTMLLTVVVSLLWSTLVYVNVSTLVAGALVVLFVLVALVTATSDPRLAATLTILSGLVLCWTLPVAVGSHTDGLDYWGPLVIPFAVALTLLAATRIGTRRMVQA